MKQSNYNFLDENSKLIVELINRKLVKIDIMKYLEIYETYQSMTGPRMERYEELAKMYNISVSCTRKYIKKMERIK